MPIISLKMKRSGQGNRGLSGIAFAFTLSAVLISGCGPTGIANEKRVKLEKFLKKVVIDTMEQDYHRHGINISVIVPQLLMDRVSVSRTKQDIHYFVAGRVTYVIKGERTWRDSEGNVIQLGPEQEITHWFTCGVLEDRYMGLLLEDKANRLTYYADKPQALN